MIRTMTIAAILASTPALAHPGDHAGFDLAALAAHLFEPDHIIFATLAGIIGVLSYRAGVRKGAAAHATELQGKSHDPR